MNLVTLACWAVATVFASSFSFGAAPMDRSALLQAMQQVMGPLPDRSHLPAPALRVIDTAAREDYTLQTITITSLYDEVVPAFLYVPIGLKPGERRPAALVLHSTGAEGKLIVDGRGPKGARLGFAAELAARGYVVIAPDYPSFGDLKDYDFAKSHYASGTMKAIGDNMRCVDLLRLLPQADPEKVCALGHSLGGHNALFTAALDPRIKAVVTSCGWTPFHHYYGGKKLVNWAQDRYMPRVRDTYHSDPDRMPFDFPALISCLAPRAVFSNSPLHDENFDVEGVRLAEKEIRQSYDAAGAGDRLVIAYPDCAHEFPEDVRESAYKFLDAQFSYTPGR